MIINTTYPNLESSKKLAKILLNKKLSACVQFTKIQSHYLWNEEIMEEEEILVTIKTRCDLYQKIEEIIKNNHEYDIPEIVGINISKGSQSYLKWIASNIEN